MKRALTTIAEILESTGMSRNETDKLLARFLQEEAFEYVEYIEEEIKRMDEQKKDPDLLAS